MNIKNIFNRAKEKISMALLMRRVNKKLKQGRHLKR